LDDSLSKWTKNRSASASLAPLICWFVWLERNVAIFEEKTPSAQSVVIRSLGSVHKLVENINQIFVRSCLINQIFEFPVACFDVAAKANGRCCGAGGTIKLSASLVHKWYMNCGSSTNSKAELMGAWATCS